MKTLSAVLLWLLVFGFQTPVYAETFHVARQAQGASDDNDRLSPTHIAGDGGKRLGQVRHDLDGNPRPLGLRYDIGAFESH